MAVLDDQRTLRRLRIIAVGAVLAGLLLAHQLGVFQHFRDPAQLKAALLSLGPWGYLAFIVAYTALQPFGVPGTVYIVAAPLIWPWPVAFALSMVGTLCASVVGFSFARFVARDWVMTQIPPRWQRHRDALSQRGLRSVFLLRLIFWMPPWLHALFGVSRVGFFTHLVGSALGYVPPLLVVSYFGQRWFDWLRAAPLGLWIGLGLLLAVLGLLFWARQRGLIKGAR